MRPTILLRLGRFLNDASHQRCQSHVSDPDLRAWRLVELNHLCTWLSCICSNKSNNVITPTGLRPCGSRTALRLPDRSQNSWRDVNLLAQLWTPRQSHASGSSYGHTAGQDVALDTCPTKAAKSGQADVAWAVAPVSWTPSLSDTCSQEPGSVTATSTDKTWLDFKAKGSRRADIRLILILLAVARVIGLGLVKLCNQSWGLKTLRWKLDTRLLEERHHRYQDWKRALHPWGSARRAWRAKLRGQGAPLASCSLLRECGKTRHQLAGQDSSSTEARDDPRPEHLQGGIVFDPDRTQKGASLHPPTTTTTPRQQTWRWPWPRGIYCPAIPSTTLPCGPNHKTPGAPPPIFVLEGFRYHVTVFLARERGLCVFCAQVPQKSTERRVRCQDRRYRLGHALAQFCGGRWRWPRRTCLELAAAVPSMRTRQPARCPVPRGPRCNRQCRPELEDLLDRHRRGAILAPSLHTEANIPPKHPLRPLGLRSPIGDDGHAFVEQFGGEEESPVLQHCDRLLEVSGHVASSGLDDFPAVSALHCGPSSPGQEPVGWVQAWPVDVDRAFWWSEAAARPRQDPPLQRSFLWPRDHGKRGHHVTWELRRTGDTKCESCSFERLARPQTASHEPPQKCFFERLQDLLRNKALIDSSMNSGVSDICSRLERDIPLHQPIALRLHRHCRTNAWH